MIAPDFTLLILKRQFHRKGSEEARKYWPTELTAVRLRVSIAFWAISYDVVYSVNSFDSLERFWQAQRLNVELQAFFAYLL